MYSGDLQDLERHAAVVYVRLRGATAGSRRLHCVIFSRNPERFHTAPRQVISCGFGLWLQQGQIGLRGMHRSLWLIGAAAELDHQQSHHANQRQEKPLAPA